MEDQPDVTDLADRLQALFAARLGLRRGPLIRRIAQARRQLPADIRADAQKVAQAAQMAGHPKLAHQIDTATLARAFDRVERHFQGPALREARRTARLHWLAGLAARLLTVAALFVAVLRWRGYL